MTFTIAFRLAGIPGKEIYGSLQEHTAHKRYKHLRSIIRQVAHKGDFATMDVAFSL